MKKFILFFIVLIGLLAGLAPYIEGYLFRDNYYQLLTWYQQKMHNKDLQIQIESYELGWMQSTAVLTLTSKDDHAPDAYKMPPMVMRIKSIIHHGPLVNINNKWQLASAGIETAFYLPDLVKAFIHEGEHGFMQIYTQVSLDGDTWNSHYLIPADVFGKSNKWNGLSGDTIIHTVNGAPENISNKFILGKISVPAFMPNLPTIEIEPITVDSETTWQSMNSWNGNANLKSAGIMAKWLDGSMFSLNNVSQFSTYHLASGLYNHDAKFLIDSMQLPPPSPIASVTNFMFSVSFKNINISSLQDFESYSDLLKALTPTTTDEMKFSFTTELGAAFAQLNLSLAALPKTENDMIISINAELNARTAQPLFEKLLISELKNRIDPLQQQDLTPQAKVIIKYLLLMGYLTMDKSDYVITFSKKGNEINLNGKIMNQDDLLNVWTNINQTILDTLAPLMPAPAVMPQTLTPTSAPTTSNTTGFNCYWMESSSGTYQWVLMPALSKTDCHALDSCDGGLKRSGGGCYKWATAPNANREPW